MTPRPSLADVDGLLSDEALAALRGRPDFRATVEQLIAESLTNYRTLDAAGRWMLADIRPDGAVWRRADPGRAAWRGERGGAHRHVQRDTGRRAGAGSPNSSASPRTPGEIVVSSGSEHWTRRRLTLRPAFVERMRRRSVNEARVISRLAPEIADLVGSLENDATYRRFLMWSGVLATRDRVVGPVSPVTMFLQRHSGMRILYHLTLDQAANRERLLEEGGDLAFSQLSNLYGVSRARHQPPAAADAEARGLLSCPTPTRVVFSPALSDDFARTMAFIIQITRAAFVATLSHGAGGPRTGSGFNRPQPGVGCSREGLEPSRPVSSSRSERAIRPRTALSA